MPCPHCNRRFNESKSFLVLNKVVAAQRHIPICKDIIHKPSPVMMSKSQSNFWKSPTRSSISPVRLKQVESRVDSGLNALRRSEGIEQYAKAMRRHLDAKRKEEQ